MTAYEFAVPLVLGAFALVGVLWLNHEERKLDRRLDAARRRRHPAE